MNDIKSLFQEHIDWQIMKVGDVEFYTYINGERCKLCINDFPEKPLYTLTFKGQSTSFDDCPSTWALPTPVQPINTVE